MITTKKLYCRYNLNDGKTFTITVNRLKEVATEDQMRAFADYVLANGTKVFEPQIQSRKVTELVTKTVKEL